MVLIENGLPIGINEIIYDIPRERITIVFEPPVHGYGYFVNLSGSYEGEL